MLKPARIVSLACLIAMGPVTAHAQEATVIEKLIAMENPCAALGTEIAGVAIGIDTLDAVTLRKASATLDGDEAILSFTGRIACRTPDAAAIPGDAVASVTADAAISLADCDRATVTVNLHDFGGTLVAAIELLSPAIEQQIAEAARPKLIEACRQFSASGDGAALPADRDTHLGNPSGASPRPQAAPGR